jgi:hypothetical protein
VGAWRFWRAVAVGSEEARQSSFLNSPLAAKRIR